jgi:hypothetical protein
VAISVSLQAQVLEEKLKVIQETVPTRIYNTCSSSAGAGSSDFHMYRMVSLSYSAQPILQAA